MDAIKYAVVKFVQSQPWAIAEPWLDIINGVLYAKYYASAEFRDTQLEKFHAEYGTVPYSNVNMWKNADVAVIPVVGILGKRMNMVGDMSTRGVSTDVLKRQMTEALNDPTVSSIVLDIDSPGGVVNGITEISDFIYQSREKKPIVAHANDKATSAAYWLASAANLVSASETADVGNIGVYMRHYDFSLANEMEGVKPTYVYAGKYKTLGNPDEPLGAEGQAILQKEVDTLYTKFVDTVARNRNIAKDVAMKDALALSADEAMERGLIDKIMTLDEAIAMASNMAKEKKNAQMMTELNARADLLLAAHRR